MDTKFFHLKPLKLTPKDKKGMGIGDIYPIVLTIALVGILIAVVMLVLGEFGETFANRERTVANESGWLNSTPYTVGHSNSTTCEGNAYAIATIWNNTENNGTIIGASGYSLSPSDGILYNASGIYPGLINFSYSYLHGGKACDATRNVSDDFTEFIPWIGVILLIVAAAIVLGILMKSFGGQGQGRV